MWFPIRVHSHYSILRSISKPSSIVEKCKEQGYEACGLTDHFTVAGAVSFVKECQKNDIKPILGAEIDICNEEFDRIGTVTLLCKTKEGWQKLLKIISRGNDEFFNEGPGITLEEIKKIGTNGLLCVTGYPDSHLLYHVFNDPTTRFIAPSIKDDAYDIAFKELQNYQEIFADLLFCTELCWGKKGDNTFALNEAIYPIIKELSEKSGVKTYLDCSAYYVNPSDYIDQHILLVSGMKCKLSNRSEFTNTTKFQHLAKFFETNQFCIPSNEIDKRADNYRRSMNSISHEEILGKFEDFSILNRPLLPHFSSNDGQSESEQLRQLCRDGWKRLAERGVITDENKQEYADRVKEELSVFEEFDLCGYFLIVADYVKYCNDNGILTGSARGSVGGCLVSYLLGITKVNPIPYGLIFARFFNKGRCTKDRVSLPDIDIDFPSNKREEVIQYLKDKYGESRVCQMITYGALKGRGVLKEVMRANEACSFEMMNQITKIIPSDAAISDQIGAYDNSVLKWSLDNLKDDLKDYVWEEDGELHGEYAEVFKQAMRLEGVYKTQGKHAAGVIVSSVDIDSVAPMIRTHGEEKIAGVEMSAAEDMGLVKFDLLATSLLTKLKEVQDYVNTNSHVV